MKKILYFILSIFVLASCSSPKYAYYFDHYDYNSGKKPVVAKVESAEVNSPLILQEEAVVASTEIIVTENKINEVKSESKVESKPQMTKEELVAKIKSMSKEEKKEFKKQVKSEVKRLKKDDGVNSTQALGHDLRYAAIFGAIGIVLLIIGGDVLGILGAISLIIGLFFFVRWLINQ